MSINKQQIRKSFTKAISTYEQEAFVQYQIAMELYRLLSVYSNYPVSSILEIGCGTGFFTRLLHSHFSSATITANDLCPEVVNYIPDDIKFISGDMETIDFPDKYDLIAGSSAIQWLEDFPLFLKKINRSLSDKGFVAISTFGEKNLIEIKEVTNIGLSYFTKSDLEHIISSSFQIIKMKEEIKTVYFSSPKDVLLHLKRSGVNGIASEKWTKSDFLYFTDRYNRLFKSDCGVPLTYHPIYIIASKK
ncbi:MAG TPA: malonyl-[acyl-carrier protein] O-methyltransferase BioC [Coprobacter fastidiosus]|uniref:Malonyl-[acyl-carrier protein] O-methyltransferase n=1 Tax=Coprobacter fastidiosus TaxID=1099853 RepID=A0A354LZ68_9BACT|nr:malonyl-[acyl-carrier protein] O-methyltransferase BioC [Coprobacter fastidiosus]